MPVCECGCGSPVKRRFVRGHNGALARWLAENPGGNQRPIDPERTERKCSTCKEIKPRSEFYRSRNTSDGMHNICKPCADAQLKDYYHRVGKYKRYGITPEDYRRMWEAQEGICAICEERPVEHIDHCHQTGRVRGLLCRPCNTALGKLGDTPEALRRALVYLERHDVDPNLVL